MTPEHLQPGDLVFFRIGGGMHVGFYDTDNQFIHAKASKSVIRSSLNNPYW
ncbi:cell wall-associated NlpC family hydrolase [Pantoea ananatis]